MIDSAMETLTSLTDAERNHFLRTVMETVYTYRQTGDPGVLRQLADDVVASVEVRRLPGYAAAAAAAPDKPSGVRGRSVAEIFSAALG